MIEFINNFHFLRPWFLLLLVLPFFIYIRSYSRKAETNSAWAKVCDKNLLDFLLIKKQSESKKSSEYLRFLILLLFPVSLAGPCWQKTENPALSVDNPLIIALNMSDVMWSKDVSPSRAVRAKYLIKDILNGVNSTETGLEVYTREPFMISPISEDKNMIDNLLNAVTYDIMPENGDRLDRAIDLAIERLYGANYVKGNIIILTSDVGERFDLALESAAKAADKGYLINVIDINSQKNPKLKMIAEKGQGVYLGYNENLKVLFDKINSIGENKIKESQNLQVVWQDNGYYLLFLPALFMLYFFRKGAMLSILFLVLFIKTADAGWFLNNNQEAMEAFNKGDFATASKKFENQYWKAGSAYKNGNYSKAGEIYSKFKDTENLYNYGNALAKSGKIKEAIEKYEEVLKLNPEHEDAKFNLEYLKKQQNQEQQQQNQKQQKKENEDKSDKQKQNSEQQQDQQNEEQQQKSEQSEDKLSENQKNKQNTQSQEDSDKDDSADTEKESPSGDSETENEAKEETAQTQNTPEEGEDKQQVQTVNSGDKDDNEEKQKMRARMQKFREIKEDKGGLLRAFIKKEYDRKRYRE